MASLFSLIVFVGRFDYIFYLVFCDTLIHKWESGSNFKVAIISSKQKRAKT
jgi:hypothetical protein